MSEAIDCDLAVIGAGVAGALPGVELADEASIVFVEAGPRIDRQAALDLYWKALFKTPESPYPSSPIYPHPLSGKPDVWYVQRGPEPFRSSYLKAVGGTTWHWLGTALRFVPDDFRLATRFGRGVDWPLTYDDLEPWYSKAEAALGVAGDDADDLGSPRRGPYPLPPIPMSYCDKVFADALVDYEVGPVRPTPQARNSVSYQDRPVCCGSASCIPLCPVQAKWDATVPLDRAEAKGARILESSVVVGLETAPDGRIALAQVRRPDGSRFQVRAKVFVLAAHGIESPRLLLHSASERYPRGLANRSDQVGRNLMDHLINHSSALSKNPVWPYRGPISTAGIERPRSGSFRAERSAYRIEIGNDGWAWPTGAQLWAVWNRAMAGLRGEALQRSLYDEGVRHIRLGCMHEQLPDPENRVELAADQLDHYGVPRPAVHYRIGDYERAGLAESHRQHAEIFRRLGASNVRHTEGYFDAGHIMGTARMGNDPDNSVVDSDLCAHDHENLFILGSAVFPTGAAANPTLTIAALSLRAVGAIRERLGRYGD
ncbi:MAG: GMC family oxidoreductase [Rhodospirillales bacterium]